MDARKDYMAPLRMWQESRLHLGPYQVPEYEDFARMVQSMEDMNARIEELEAERDSYRNAANGLAERVMGKEARADRAEALLKEAVETLRQTEEAVRLLEKGDTRFALLSIAYGLRENLRHFAHIAQEGKE